MTNASLAKFKASKGWTAGADASVTAVNIGANGSIDTRTVGNSVLSFTLSNAGLMANLSIEGTKISALAL